MNWENEYFTRFSLIYYYPAVFTIALSSIITPSNYTSGGKLDPKQASYDVIYYDLAFTVIPEKKYLKAKSNAKIRILSSIDSLKLNLVNNYIVDEIKINNQISSFQHFGDILQIKLPDNITGMIETSIVYEGQPPVAPNPPWDGGFTWAYDSKGKPWIGMTSANEGGKIFFPCKDHPSDRADSASISITIPKGLSAASNGKLVDIQHTDSSSTFYWKTNYPIANYNINFSIGNFYKYERPFISIKNNQMPIIFYTLEENKDKAEFHVDMAMNMISSHEKYFGEYPFISEKFGLVETPYLGMEHQTINAYGNEFKYTKLGENLFDWLLLHELGHEWWGNKVKSKDWSDYWIHEGICTYADALYHREVTGEKGYHKKMSNLKNGIRNLNPIIPKRNASTDEVYQGDIYNKGSYLMHSLRFIMGDRKFFKALKEFATLDSFIYDNFVSESVFTKHFSFVGRQDLSSFIYMILYTTNLPKAIVTEVDSGKYKIEIHRLSIKFPIEIQTDKRIFRKIIGKKPIFMRSKTKPIIDPNNWYLWDRDFPTDS
ncbi:MAG: peptidase M1 [Candidatus Marinimicrobia bacterium]|nr:peptidase M1 [Candidatus Neomarinimicrobiota bacterium]|tara:strand:- start:6223 stop:7854 length:1632 start_codon:yes stop_codon:yes gene_type:complete